MTFADRDAAPVEALVVDRYLEALLDGTSGPRDARVDPALQATARRLHRDLVRIHPSFRFEERLARRLAEYAAGRSLAQAAGAEGRVVPFPVGPLAGASTGPDRARDLDDEAATLLAIAEGRLDPAALVASSRPILLGGAMASAVLSLAGVVFVAWRATRPQPPMRRAVRAVQRARPARPLSRGRLA